MIVKFAGGGLTAPFVQWTPVTVNTASPETETTTTSSSKKSESGELAIKDLLTSLKDIDGLPSDMNALYSGLVNYFRLSEMQGGFDTTSLATRFIQTQKMIRDAVFRKKLFDKVYDLLEDNGGLNEVAISKDGSLMGFVDNEFKFYDPSKITDEEKQTLITNNQLLSLRANLVPNNDNITMIASNGIGINTVIKLLKDSMISMGTNEDIREGYMRNPLRLAILALNLELQKILSSDKSELEKLQLIAALDRQMRDLYSGTEEDGLYKYTNVTKSQAKLMEAALNYLWVALPQNARALLTYKSEGHPYQLMMNLLSSGASLTVSFKWDMIENADGVKPGSKESSDKQTRNLDPVTGFIEGLGYLKKTRINTGNFVAFEVNGRYSSLVDNSGNILKPNDTLLDVMSSAFLGVLDLNSITMGNLLIDGDRSKVLINDANIIRVDLPIDKSAPEGIIRPDLAMLDKVENAESEIKIRGIKDEEGMNKVYEEMDLPPKFVKTANGWEGNVLDWTSFAVIGAAVEESAFSKLEDDSLLMPIKNDSKKKEMIGVFTNKDKDYDEGMLWWAKNFYQGQIFIPLRDNLVSASYSSGNYYKVNGNDALDVEEKQGLQQRYNKAKPLSAVK